MDGDNDRLFDRSESVGNEFDSAEVVERSVASVSDADDDAQGARMHSPDPVAWLRFTGGLCSRPGEDRSPLLFE